MELWIIEPRDPLIVRDGRPFGPNPGARARSLDFPYPSTIAGGFRSQAGKDSDGRFDITVRNTVKKISIYGPLLVELNDNDIARWLVPAPGDALLLRKDDVTPVHRHRLQPLKMGNSLSDLPDKLNELEWPVGLPKPDLTKSYKDTPHYWYWENFTEWLMAPPATPEPLDSQLLGHNGPDKEWRMHVAIDPDSLAGVEGALFATSGLEFRRRPLGDERLLSRVKRLGLATAVENLNSLTIAEGNAPLGGERRTMHWQRSTYALPQMPARLAEKITETGACRLILLTPAYFEAGWWPSWLLQTRFGITPILKAAVVGKSQTVSGWDFEKNGPKPTRRLAPAGTVFFLRLAGEKMNIGRWLNHIWMQNISDVPQDRLDGFGLAVAGTWSGNPVPMFQEEA